ncbi:13359_t:CDS:2 [Entrophospora sp. SA101]|nr:13359_t:CDS:2 [Entrophospora sp. SA101]
MAPLTKRSKQLLKAPPVIQNQTLIEPPIDLNISSTFSNKAVKAKKELMNKINILPEKQIFSCSKLLEIMMVKENKHTYTPEFIALVTQMSNIGQSSLSSTVQCTREFFTFLVGDSPDTWISTSTLSKWNQDVARITVSENLPGTTSQFSSYGIVADESTRGDKKIFLVCVSHWNVVEEKPILTILNMKDLDRSDTNSSHPLPNGYRAHQMPDMVQTWISELENIVHEPEKIFMDELLAASDHLNEQEFLNLAQRMQIGIEKTSNAFKKWLITWIKFLLCICSLGGEHGPEFAQAILHVIFSHPFPDDQPTVIVKKYIGRLNKNLEDQSNSLGLFEALEKNNFREQFVAFSKANYIQLKEFPLIYDFVRHRIWSIIVHQQHLEGMFNRFDIRTHPNMLRC